MVEPLEGARVGATVGKYRLDRLLGVGGMASVYGATDSEGRRVAIKILDPELAQNDHLRSRFLREGYAANKIGHAGVVRILGDGTDASGTVFLIMELFEGHTLEALWERSEKRLPLLEVLVHLDRLLGVLEAAHKHSVIHRDIKPANIFLTTEGALKVLDFGIARCLDDVGATRSGQLLGTPAFLPPEQAGGRLREIDARTDIWAAGATAFTLLSGEYVHGRTTTPMMIVAATRHARSLARVAPNVPEKVSEVIDVALSFDMGKRWPSARMMRHALRAAHPYKVPKRSIPDLSTGK